MFILLQEILFCHYPSWKKGVHSCLLVGRSKMLNTTKAPRQYCLLFVSLNLLLVRTVLVVVVLLLVVLQLLVLLPVQLYLYSVTTIKNQKVQQLYSSSSYIILLITPLPPSLLPVVALLSFLIPPSPPSSAFLPASSHPKLLCNPLPLQSHSIPILASSLYCYKRPCSIASIGCSAVY